MLDLIGITKQFGTQFAVREASVSVRESELLAILGPSGCGKTTLLRIIAGLEAADAGRVVMNDRDWTALAPQKRDVAMVFQNYALYPHRSVRGNIEYPLKVRGIGPKERSRRLDWIAGLLSITNLLDRKPQTLSGGEAQRVALARALVREPACFLLDEPVSSLDARLRCQSRAEIKRLQREIGVTTVYVTHDQDDALAIADRIAIMESGRIIQVGTPDEVMDAPATTFVAQFLGNPAMNLIEATIGEPNTRASQVVLDASGNARHVLAMPNSYLASHGQKIFVGFRPWHVEVLPSAAASNDNLGGYTKVPGRIDLIEGVEPQVVVHCETDVGKIQVRVARKPTDQAICLGFDPTKAHLFDKETGARIEVEFARVQT